MVFVVLSQEVDVFKVGGVLSDQSSTSEDIAILLEAPLIGEIVDVCEKVLARDTM